MRRKEECGKKLRRMMICGKTVIDGGAWLSGNPHKVKMSWEEEEICHGTNLM
jgi:hypothetical protein